MQSGANFAGAAGPMQIGIGGKAGNTFGGAPVRVVPPELDYTDGNGDGIASVYDPPTPSSRQPSTCVATALSRGATSGRRSSPTTTPTGTWEAAKIAQSYATGGASGCRACCGLCPCPARQALPVGAAGENGRFDCSGLTMRVGGGRRGAPAQLGGPVRLGRAAHRRSQPGPPGDLVYFAYDVTAPSTIHHVGIYIGNGKMIERHTAMRSDRQCLPQGLHRGHAAERLGGAGCLEAPGTVPDWPPRPMPPAPQPPRVRRGLVEGDHGGDPPEGRAVDGWPSSLVGSASGRPPRSRALLLLLAGGVVLVVAVVAIVAALTGQSPDKAVSTCTDGPSACVLRASGQPGGDVSLRSGSGYRLEVPAGWRDQTPELGRRVARVPADLVLTGHPGLCRHDHGGPGRRRRSAGAAEPAAHPGRRRGAPLARSTVGRRAASGDGGRASGIRYDFVFVAGDGQVRGSQVVVDHGGDRYFVTYEARPGAFESRLFTGLLRGWQWR